MELGRSSGLTHGQISAVPTTSRDGGDVFDDLTVFPQISDSYFAVPGDSGALAFAEDGTVHVVEMVIVGIFPRTREHREEWGHSICPTFLEIISGREEIDKPGTKYGHCA
jgi:hypothetical protein